MKSLFFAVGLVVFIVYRGDKTKVNMRGTWEGLYNKNEKLVDIKIVFVNNNTLEMYSSEVNRVDKFTGSYIISDNNKIAIICKQKGNDEIALSMNGSLSPKRDFVRGGWEDGKYLYGDFYIGKAALK